MGITLLPSRRKKVSNLLPTRLSESYIYIYIQSTPVSSIQRLRVVFDFCEKCCIGFSKRLFQRGSGDRRVHDG